MRLFMRTASLAVVAYVIGGIVAHAQEDEVVRVERTDETEARQKKVIVTGSAIRGTPEDAALPVNVYSADELELQGSPTGLDFAKNLTQSGPTYGESNYFGGGNRIGAPAFNLRNLGPDNTLTLLNGRRVSENISNIPMMALERTEVLKDGAATIYGADAVGGVVNFITKSEFVGFDVKADYKYVDGSDGEWDIGALYGIGDGPTNLMVSAEWSHRSRLETEERDFSSLPYWENPTAWSFLTNLGRYLPQTAGGTTIGSLYDYTQESCESQGGIYAPNSPGGTACNYGYASYYNLVEDQDIFRVYGQLNTEIDENTDFHIEVAYADVKVPNQFNSPSLPTTQGPATTTGATFQYFVPQTNPYVAEFAARTGWDQSPLYGLTDRYSIVLLRPFAHQGQTVTSGGEGNSNSASVDNQIWRISTSLDGSLGSMFGPAAGIDYDFAVTYNQQKFTYEDADYLGFRLQEALNGFGGPACNAPDLDPNTLGTQNPGAAGQDGCLWFNPFSSSYSQQPELGLDNPNYVPGAENDPVLIGWLFDPRHAETTTTNLIVDLVFNGMTPIELPGGTIGWAAGTQWRQDETSEFNPSDFHNGAVPCAWPEGQRPLPNTDPKFNGCTLNRPGPFGFYGIDEAEAYDRQAISYFVEVNLPVHDRLNIQAAARREEFSGGLDATVYKVAGKWDVFGPLSARASYGTNFLAPDIILSPGSVSNIVRSYDRANGNWLGAQTVTRTDIEPEEAESWNLGLIWDSEGFASGHHLSVMVDYFDIHLKGEIDQLATNNQIANIVFAESTGLADCSNPLIGRIVFNNTDSSPNGQCVQGASSINDLNTVITDIGNGSDQLTAGFDFAVRYDLPVYDGDLTFGVDGTRVTKLETTARILDGVEVAPADDRLGYLNFESIPFSAPEWRVNGFINFNRERHNLRLTARYVSGVEDERGGVDPLGYYPGTTDEIGLITKGVDVDHSLRFDTTYVFNFSDTLAFSATVANIFDEDPPYVRAEFGYDPRTADALGRTIQVGVKATF